MPDATTAATTHPVMVTGATGRQGGTGFGVLTHLLRAGVPVRAMVRRLDDRADGLRRLGAEVVPGDFADYPSLLAALAGVRSAYFCYPVAAGIAEAAGLFAAAGRATGLERVVDLSLGSTSPTAASPQVRAQFVAERIFDWAGFGGVHLRVAAFFMENVAFIDGDGVRRHGRIANSFGDHPLSWISGADVGAMAAALLLDPALTGDRVLTVGGVERLTYPQIAATLSTVLGRRIEYQELTPEQWHGALVAASEAAGQGNARAADHLVAQAKAVRSAPGGLPLGDDVRRLTGRPPTSFAAFVLGRRAEFGDASES